MLHYCLYFRGGLYNEYVKIIPTVYRIEDVYLLKKLVWDFKIKDMDKHLYLMRFFELKRK